MLRIKSQPFLLLLRFTLLYLCYSQLYKRALFYFSSCWGTQECTIFPPASLTSHGGNPSATRWWWEVSFHGGLSFYDKVACRYCCALYSTPMQGTVNERQSSAQMPAHQSCPSDTASLQQICYGICEPNKVDMVKRYK